MKVENFYQHFRAHARALECQRIEAENKIRIKNIPLKPAIYKGIRTLKKLNVVSLNKLRKLSIRITKKPFKNRSRIRDLQSIQEHLEKTEKII